MWTRERTLGRGSFGTVSLAHSSTRSQSKHIHSSDIIVKLPPLFAVKSARMSRYHSVHKERKLFRLFQQVCPYILHCHGYVVTVEKRDLIYNLILEYASGGSLKDRIRSFGCGCGGGLLEDDVGRYTKMILLGLDHIHSSGYVHCDIKPHNILIVRRTNSDLADEIVKIADFGLAKRAGKKKSYKKGESGLRGTPLYVAPESVRDNEYEPSSDVWALGCTVLEMLTGKPAWKSNEPMNLLYRIGFTSELPEIPSAGRISVAAIDFVKKCLIRDPKRRWTIDMLLKHPFLNAKERRRRDRPVPEVKTSDSESKNIFCESFISLDHLIPHQSSTVTEDDLLPESCLRPNLLMLNKLNQNDEERRRRDRPVPEAKTRSSELKNIFCESFISLDHLISHHSGTVTEDDSLPESCLRPDLLMLNKVNQNAEERRRRDRPVPEAKTRDSESKNIFCESFISLDHLLSHHSGTVTEDDLLSESCLRPNLQMLNKLNQNGFFLGSKNHAFANQAEALHDACASQEAGCKRTIFQKKRKRLEEDEVLAP